MKKCIFLIGLIVWTPVFAGWIDGPEKTDSEYHEATAANLSSVACRVGYSTGTIYNCPDEFPDFTFEFAACLIAFKDSEKRTACLEKVYREFSTELGKRF